MARIHQCSRFGHPSVFGQQENILHLWKVVFKINLSKSSYFLLSFIAEKKLTCFICGGIRKLVTFYESLTNIETICFCVTDFYCQKMCTIVPFDRSAFHLKAQHPNRRITANSVLLSVNKITDIFWC